MVRLIKRNIANLKIPMIVVPITLMTLSMECSVICLSAQTQLFVWHGMTSFMFATVATVLNSHDVQSNSTLQSGCGRILF